MFDLPATEPEPSRRDWNSSPAEPTCTIALGVAAVFGAMLLEIYVAPAMLRLAAVITVLVSGICAIRWTERLFVRFVAGLTTGAAAVASGYLAYELLR